MRNATIVGTGLFAPGEAIPNEYFDKHYRTELSPYLEQKRNIFSRHLMGKEQCTSDLIVPAAKQAMEQAGVTPNEIDLIIVSTDTPDYISPSTAAVVQYKLGAEKAGTFDINSACAGFATALDIANKYMAMDEQYEHILVVGAYGMSKYFDWSDYKVTSTFADGAGAVVLKANKDPKFGIQASQLFTDGKFHDHMGIYAGGTRNPLNSENMEKKLHKLQFVKKIPAETNGHHWPRLSNILFDRTNQKTSDIDHFFFTQINIASIWETMDKLQVNREKSHNVMHKFGYTGSACIPMALADAASEHKLKQGDSVFILGSGGGMSMAALALTWSFDS